MGGYGSAAYAGASSSPRDAPAAQGFNQGWLSTGTTWGNSTQRSNMTTAINALQSSGWFQEDPIHLYGGSAGGVCVLQWALANPSRVRSIFLNITPVDLQSLYDRDPLSLAGSIDTAFGGRPGDEDNPALRADELTEIPIAVAYSSDDTIGLPSESEAFITATGATAINMGDQGHSWDSALLNSSSVASFFNAN